MSEQEPKQLTIVGAHFDAGVRSWKILLSDGSVLGGIRACQVTAEYDSVTQIEMTSYIYKRT